MYLKSNVSSQRSALELNFKYGLITWATQRRRDAEGA